VSSANAPQGSQSQNVPFSGARPSAAPFPSRAEKPNLRATQRHMIVPEERDRALLVRTDATNSGQVFKLQGETFGMGRHPENQICVDDDGISRHHARISIKNGSEFWIEDLQSSNGTYLNGRRINSCQMSNGDTLHLGPRVCFRLSIATEHEEQVLKQLYEASVRDPLTGAYNRHHFASRLAAEIAYAARHNVALSLILFDIDFFKKVNDTYGHLAGDAALIHVANSFNRKLRTEDLLARYGGEEFVILLRGITVEKTAAVAERLRASLETETITQGTQSFKVTASFGCASLLCCSIATPDTLIETADERLYSAKQSGRNRVVSVD
jgi:diguanylate cyclase (GGDEF)-like protein